MSCYFQGCEAKGTTKEHIPPRAFFPKDERLGLLTVKSCDVHNGGKSVNDLYVLAQICMNASPSNRAREIFQERVVPQLSYNNNALRNLLAKGATVLPGGVAYAVDLKRFDDFFTALVCGLVYKSQNQRLPADYRISHIYHRFIREPNAELHGLEREIDKFYDGKPLTSLEFGRPDARNERIYSVEIHGVPGYLGSITIVHRFFGVFKVTSMLTKVGVIGDGPNVT